MKLLSWLSLAATILLLALLPLLFGQMMLAGLGKLHLSPQAALALMIAIIFGGMINIPVRRIRHGKKVTAHPLALFGLGEVLPRLQRVRQDTIIAVNLGGCLIPAGLALYELANLAALGWPALAEAGIAAGLNILACYLMAQPVAGIGIVMPGLVSPFIAASLALLLAPESAAPVAFIAGVTGPLVGADLLHLKDIEKVAVGIASIGGAGTFDGIVLSGIVAAYLT
jgi:uncharacterized membrane protein